MSQLDVVSVVDGISEVVCLEVTKRYAPGDAAPGVTITLVPCTEAAPAPALEQHGNHVQHGDARDLFSSP